MKLSKKVRFKFYLVLILSTKNNSSNNRFNIIECIECYTSLVLNKSTRQDLTSIEIVNLNYELVKLLTCWPSLFLLTTAVVV